MTHRICLCLLAGVLMTAASAMASETRVAIVNVPFAFTVGRHEMPAGEYSISKTEQHIVFLRTAGKTVAVLPVGSIQGGFDGSSSKVRFVRVGGRSILKEVVVGGADGFLMLK